MFDPLAEGKKFEALLRERNKQFMGRGQGKTGMFCQTPGLKVRSGGRGRGMARGRGLGPMGRPYYDK